MKDDLFDDGEVFYAFMKYKDATENIGKKRPVVVVRDSETGILMSLKVTSRTDNPLNHKYGYNLKDWEESGLNRPSIVKCNQEDIEIIQSNNIISKLGDLSERDLKGVLIKMVKVRQNELFYERKKSQNRER